MAEGKKKEIDTTTEKAGPSVLVQPSEPIRILTLEDNPFDFELIQAELREANLRFTAKRVDTRAGFIKELRVFSPHIVLSDYSLIGFTGSDALRVLKSDGPHIPFILVTGSQSEEVAAACMREGADDYILKSSLKRLPGAILNALERHVHQHKKEKAEAELRRQRDVYETLLDTQSDAGLGCAIVSGNSQKFIFVNDAFCRISGYGEEELRALPSYFKLVAPDRVYSLEAWVRRYILKQERPEAFETVIARKDGGGVEVEITARRPRLDHGNQVVVIIRDISERVRHEAELQRVLKVLRESEEHFRLLFEGVKDYAIFMLDPLGRVVNWNSGAERIIGYGATEIVGKHFSCFFTPEETKNGTPGHDLQVAVERGRSEEEGWRIRKDASLFVANEILTPIRNQHGGLIGYSVVMRDLSERKKAEDKLRQQGEDLRALARHLESVREEERFRISRELHDELGQVLTALRMELSILQRRVTKVVDEATRPSLLEKITSMSRLVETTIQSVRKIVSELRPTVLDEFGLSTAIQWQAQEFENRTGIRCMVSRLQRDIPLKPNQTTAIFRMLQEALTNVARHAQATKVRISFEENNGCLILRIKDNGKGIEANRISRRKSFGLIGMEERARMLKGDVEFTGKRGEGTTVVVRIPIQET